MNSDIQKASEVLFDLVVCLEPRLAPLADWYKLLVSTIDLWQRSEGNQGIKRAKDILSQGWLAILGEDNHQLDFVKSKDGLPELVIPLVSRVTSLKLDKRLLSATLSLIRVTDLWYGQKQDSTVNQSLDVIQNSRLPVTARAVIDEFEEFVKLFVSSYPNHPIVKAWNKALTLGEKDFVIYRESKGVNGPLTANAHRDIVTLMEATCQDDKSLLGHICQLQQCVIDNVSNYSFHVSTSFMDAIANWEGHNELKHSDAPGKLSMIEEKSGKLRIVAQPDYFSQLSLNPINRWLFDVLKSWDSDCTFDQRRSIPKICAWQESGTEISSFDQSSCTDLFPFELQLKVLDARFGHPLTEAVRTVMSDRDWKIQLPSGRTKKVRWSVGQPMGMFVSWSLMALTHHFLVQYCYWKSSGKTFTKKGPFDKYVICGDDIVIASKSVSDCYRKVVSQLGMKINLAKSHISGGMTKVPPVAEFAKVITWKGQPLFPIRPNMVLSSIKDWRNTVPLLIDITNVDGFSARLKHVERIIKKHYSTRSKFLIPLLTIPSELGGVGFRDSESMVKKFETLDSRQIHPWLYFLASKVRSGLLIEQKQLQVYEDTLSDLPVDIYREHPLVQYARTRRSHDMWKRSFDGEIPSVNQLVYEIMNEGFGSYTRFLTKVDNPAVPPWDEGKDREQLSNRTLWERALAKPHYLTTARTVLLEASWKAESLMELVNPSFLTPDALPIFKQRQYDIVVETMLARRFE